MILKPCGRKARPGVAGANPHPDRHHCRSRRGSGGLPRPAHIPLRVTTGAYILNSGLSKQGHPDGSPITERRSGPGPRWRSSMSGPQLPVNEPVGTCGRPHPTAPGFSGPAHPDPSISAALSLAVVQVWPGRLRGRPTRRRCRRHCRAALSPCGGPVSGRRLACRPWRQRFTGRRRSSNPARTSSRIATTSRTTPIVNHRAEPLIVYGIAEGVLLSALPVLITCPGVRAGMVRRGRRRRPLGAELPPHPTDDTGRLSSSLSAS